MNIDVKRTLLVPAIIGLSIISSSALAQDALSLNQGKVQISAGLEASSNLPQQQRLDIARVKPLLFVDANDHLSYSQAAASRANLNASAKELLQSSVMHVNSMVDSGRFELLSDGSLRDRAQSFRAAANQNFLNVYWWWGYYGGISHSVITRIDQGVAGVSGIYALLKYIGWEAPEVAIACAVVIGAYLGWINLIDEIGGERGVTFTAIWPWLYAPTIWYQH